MIVLHSLKICKIKNKSMASRSVVPAIDGSKTAEHRSNRIRISFDQTAPHSNGCPRSSRSAKTACSRVYSCGTIWCTELRVRCRYNVNAPTHTHIIIIDTNNNIISNIVHDVPGTIRLPMKMTYGFTTTTDSTVFPRSKNTIIKNRK